MSAPGGVVGTEARGPGRKHLASLVVGAMGVVFGDIGTSPLYTLRECFSQQHGLALTEAHILQILSVIFWALTIVVTLKYVTLIMRADNRGEGGIMALTALVSSGLANGRARWWLVGLGIFGAAMFYGDGMITPAISVLSAVEGLEVVAPALKPWVVPRDHRSSWSVLFSIQRHGTARVGVLFGPVMCVWFVTIAALGVGQIVRVPAVLKALNPAYAVDFFVGSPLAAFLALGAVVLAVTGTEALYADMGHFGARPIRRAWLFFVLPALVLNYFGQGALLIQDPEAIHNPFYLPGARLGARAAGGAGDVRDRDRVAGRHLGRVLAHAAGDPDGLLPAADHHAHVEPPDRPDLRAVHQLDAAGRRDRARRRLPDVEQSRRRVRHRGDAGDAHRFAAHLRGPDAGCGDGTATPRCASWCRCW